MKQLTKMLIFQLEMQSLTIELLQALVMTISLLMNMINSLVFQLKQILEKLTVQVSGSGSLNSFSMLSFLYFIGLERNSAWIMLHFLVEKMYLLLCLPCFSVHLPLVKQTSSDLIWERQRKLEMSSLTLSNHNLRSMLLTLAVMLSVQIHQASKERLNSETFGSDTQQEEMNGYLKILTLSYIRMNQWLSLESQVVERVLQ